MSTTTQHTIPSNPLREPTEDKLTKPDYRFLIYSRRSRIRSEEAGQGVQRTHETAEWQIKNYLANLTRSGKTYEIVETASEDISGFGYYTKRPKITRFVELCREDKTLTLLASKCDRIARDCWTGAELLKTINLVVAESPKATDLELQVKFSFSEAEVKAQSDRRIAQYQAKKATCEETGVDFIWGGNSEKWKKSYFANQQNHQSTKNRTVERVRMIPAVDEIKKMLKYNPTIKMQEIACNLNSEGYTTVRGCEFSKATVSKLITKNNINYQKKHKSTCL